MHKQGASLAVLARAGIPRLLVGDAAGRMSIHALDGVAFPEVAGAQLMSAPLDGLNFAGSGGLWVGSGGTLTRVLGGAATFQSANYGSGFGRNLGGLAGKP